MLGKTFSQAAASYVSAREQTFKDHPTAVIFRHDCPAEVRNTLGTTYEHFQIKGSAGQGIWAAVPWIGIFDPLITTSATKGYYVVYLFCADMSYIYLSMNQGTTSVYEEFAPASRALSVLRDRAAIMRARLPEYRDRFDAEPIHLKDTGGLPKGYEAGHAFGRSYDPTQLPSEQELKADLAAMVRLYSALTARGGLDAGIFEDAGGDDFALGSNSTVIERRRYRLHNRIERANLDKVKKAHGYRCAVCEFNFVERYGEIGKNFIEAHHLTPMSSLPEDKPVSMRALEDFAVLCSNCHRMIHRLDDPADLDGLRGLLIR